jgi:hypothetical protein
MPHHVLPNSRSDHKFILRFQSRRPSDRQADRFAFKIPESRTPAILLGPFDQSGTNRVPVHVFQFLLDLLSRPDVESVGLRLPDHDPFGLALLKEGSTLVAGKRRELDVLLLVEDSSFDHDANSFAERESITQIEAGWCCTSLLKQPGQF